MQLSEQMDSKTTNKVGGYDMQLCAHQHHLCDEREALICAIRLRRFRWF